MSNRLGCYLKAICCEDCDWFQKPPSANPYIPHIDRDVCPGCGGSTTSMVGRFLLKDEHKGVVFKRKEVSVVGFVRGREGE